MASAAGCSDDDPASADPEATATSASTTDATTEGAGASSPDASDDALLGSWHRAQTCAEMLAAFEAAGLAESHRGWLQGNFYGGEPGPTSGDPCAGAHGPLEHDHFFTADGGFGSHDQHGEEVDSGDYELIDLDAVIFPSHADEFGYDSDIVVHYVVNGDAARFDVALPEQCVEACADAYAWALSAFASGPWERGEVPG
jgi:hypothetical protein